jgi:hypothetical protein
VAHVDAGVAVAVAVAAYRDAGVSDASAPSAHLDAAAPAAVPAVRHGAPATPIPPDPGVVATQPAAAVTSAPSPARASVEKGALSIYVAPFAQVWVDDAREPAGETPLHLKLRVGSHRIHLGKHNQKLKTVLVIVSTAKEAVIDERW